MSGSFWDEESECGKIDRNPAKGIILKFKVVSRKDKKYFDIREYYLNRETNEYMPTKKGIVVPKEMFEDFLNMLNNVRKNLIEKNGDTSDLEEIERLLRDN